MRSFTPCPSRHLVAENMPEFGSSSAAGLAHPAPAQMQSNHTCQILRTVQDWFDHRRRLHDDGLQPIMIYNDERRCHVCGETSQYVVECPHCQLMTCDPNRGGHDYSCWRGVCGVCHQDFCQLCDPCWATKKRPRTHIEIFDDRAREIKRRIHSFDDKCVLCVVPFNGTDFVPRDDEKCASVRAADWRRSSTFRRLADV